MKKSVNFNRKASAIIISVLCLILLSHPKASSQWNTIRHAGFSAVEVDYTSIAVSGNNFLYF